MERPPGLPIENVLEVTAMGLMEDRGFSVAEVGFCDLMVLRRLVGFVIPMDDLNGDGGETSAGLEEETLSSVALLATEEDGGTSFESVANVDETFSFSLVLTCTLVLLTVTVCGGNVVSVALISSEELEPSFGDLSSKISGFLSTFLDLVSTYSGIAFTFSASKETGASTFITFL